MHHIMKLGSLVFGMAVGKHPIAYRESRVGFAPPPPPTHTPTHHPLAMRS